MGIITVGMMWGNFNPVESAKEVNDADDPRTPFNVSGRIVMLFIGGVSIIRLHANMLCVLVVICYVD